MRPPKKFPTMKMPMPVSRVGMKAQAVLSSFAHHPPTTAEVTPRMERPGRPHPPHN